MQKKNKRASRQVDTRIQKNSCVCIQIWGHVDKAQTLTDKQVCPWTTHSVSLSVWTRRFIMFGRQLLTFFRDWNEDFCCFFTNLALYENLSPFYTGLIKPQEEMFLEMWGLKKMVFLKSCEKYKEVMIASLELSCNKSWSWRKISNQIWPISKEKCVRRLYCFGDGPIRSRKQRLRASKLSPYLHAQITKLKQVPTSIVVSQLYANTAKRGRNTWKQREV